MKHPDPGTEPQMNTYSPFRPVLAVFITLAVLQGFHLKGNLDFRSQLRTAEGKIAKLAEAQAISDTVEKVSKDLLQLSDGKTNEAAKIIDEFKIRLNNPPPPPQK